MIMSFNVGPTLVVYVVVFSQCSLSIPLLVQGGMTALMIAAQNGHLEVVKQHISSGASVDATTKVSVKVTSEQQTA